MNAEVALCDILLDTAGVTALVDTRVWQLKIPQTPTLPAVRVQLVDEVTEYHQRGEQGTNPTVVQVDAIAAESSGADPYAAASALALAIHVALSGQKFSLGSPPFVITGVFRIVRLAMYEPGEYREVKVIQRYVVWSHT